MKVTVTRMVKKIGAAFLALLAGISLPLLIWIAIITILRQIFAEWRAIRPQLLLGNLTCGISTDCPPGYECVSGRCLPKPSR